MLPVLISALLAVVVLVLMVKTGVPLFAMMSDLVGKDASQIQSKGGRLFYYKRVTSAGADLGTPDTWHEVGYQEDFSYKWGQPMKQVNDRSGDPVATNVDNLTMEAMVKLLQHGADTEIFLKDEVGPSVFFALFSDHGFTTSGKTLYRFAPIAQIEKSAEIKDSDRRPEMKIVLSRNNASVTPATVPTGFPIAASFTTAAGKYFTPYEAVAA